MKGQQLPLAVQLRDSASFESFYAGANSEAVTALRAARTNIFLFGAPASGKTHLLQATARAAGAAYLPLAQLAGLGPDVLEGYSGVPALCLDDADAVLTRRDWALALLRLLDGLGARGARYVISAQSAPERLGIVLPDVRTRLNACALFGLRPLNDEDRSILLRERAQARGLELSEDVARWLLTRLARDTGTLLQALEQLDRASLSAKRRLTLPFVQTVLVQSVPAPADARKAPG